MMLSGDEMRGILRWDYWRQSGSVSVSSPSVTEWPSFTFLLLQKSSSRHCFKHIIWLWMSVRKKKFHICFMWSFDLKWTYYDFLCMPKAQATDCLKHLVLHIFLHALEVLNEKSFFYLFIFVSLTGKIYTHNYVLSSSPHLVATDGSPPWAWFC